ncbi:MAG: ATP-binding protein [Polyangiaceae bacterium]|nr:ATP-binding protein [Polyangiaceae bacterium]
MAKNAEEYRYGEAEIGPQATSVTSVADEEARLEQALLDIAVSQATAMSLVHCPSITLENQLLRALRETAHTRRFVVATISMREHPVDTLDDLVACLLDALAIRSDDRRKGILFLLDRFFEKKGKKSVQRFSDECEELGASGDLVTLCAAYLDAEDDAKREVRAFEKWSQGEVTPYGEKLGVRSRLTSRNAQRVFADLSRVVQALGYAGLVVFLSEGEALAERSDRQRERGYTVLRELVDNFDSARGAMATKLVITGQDSLFEGERSLRSLPALLTRLRVPSPALPPPPHRTWTSILRAPEEYIHRRIRAPKDSKPGAIRSLIRVSQGLPPTEAVTSMSVGHEGIDRTISKLFNHAEMAGSVFQFISGEYGSGKTHLLLHLAERALAEGHPVFWLNLERMNIDLGNPQRHLSRVLEMSVMPKRSRQSARERASVWTRSKGKLKKLTTALEEIAGHDTEEAQAAKKCLSVAQQSENSGPAIENFLLGLDLKDKPSAANYRQDAYRRILLWCELLTRLDGAAGPVILIDEAENLYTSGVSRHARRAALRTLSFYCGGLVPSATVLLAMTPNVLVQMRKESRLLLNELKDVDSTLELEDVDIFRRRLLKLQPDTVPEFSKKMRKLLAEKVRTTHRSVRGDVAMEDWDGLVRQVTKSVEPPRVIVRALLDELEASWWRGN